MITLAVTTATAMADTVAAAIDAGAGAGTLEVYTGTKPATAETAATGTLLATWTLADPALVAAVAGVADLDADPDLTAPVATDGDAGWFRVADSTGAVVFDGECGTTGGVEADLNFDTLSWLAAGTVSITTGTVTQPTE
jgi:hypothetical protein